MMLDLDTSNSFFGSMRAARIGLASDPAPRAHRVLPCEEQPRSSRLACAARTKSP